VKRREFITALGSAAAWPMAVRAQQRAMPIIGYLDVGTFDTTRESVAAFLRGLSEAGYLEGRNVAIEYRWPEDHLDRLPALADDLVRRQVAVVVAFNTPPALAAKAATNSIPIVFSMGSDPVEIGLVASLKRPGGNLTGIYTFNATLAAKRLELMHELVPSATSVAYLANPTNSVFGKIETKELEVAARALGVRLLILNASHESEFEVAFRTLVNERAGGLLVGGDTLFRNHANRLVALAARHRVPAIYSFRDQTVAGGLLSYGTDFSASRHQAGIYAGRILKGEKPADLPVQQITKVQLVINLKTANTLGLAIPEARLATADEVIQ
jgi:putative tryptophan/tyrosine transport system substrate-binding protein